MSNKTKSLNLTDKILIGITAAVLVMAVIIVSVVIVNREKLATMVKPENKEIVTETLGEIDVSEEEAIDSIPEITSQQSEVNGENVPEDNADITQATVQQRSEDELFNEYINSNFSINNTLNPSDDGVFNALIKDFDGDGTKEMVAFSIRNDEHSGAYVTISLYTIKDSTVQLSDTSEEIKYPRVGAYGNVMCATTENDSINIYLSYMCSGGSQVGDNFFSFKVSRGDLILSKHYYLYSYPRYERLDLLEKVNNYSYASQEEFYSAVESAGFSSKAHIHSDDVGTEGIDVSTISDEHIFVIIDDDRMMTYLTLKRIYNKQNVLGN